MATTTTIQITRVQAPPFPPPHRSIIPVGESREKVKQGHHHHLSLSLSKKEERKKKVVK